MRSTRHAVGVGCAVATLLLGAGVTQAADFDGFGSHIGAYKGAVPITASAYRAAFAPDGLTMYYLIDSANASTQGLYAVTFAPDYLSGVDSGRIALGDFANPSDVVVGADGSAYVCYDFTAAVRKVADPMGARIETTLFSGNTFLGGTGDDDPVSIGIAPAGFSGLNVNPGDIILGDNGLDANGTQAVESVAPDGSSSKIITQWTTLPNGATNPNLDLMAVDPVHNRVYLAGIDMAIEVGSDTQTSIFTLSADGTLTEHILTIPEGRDLSNCQAVAVNPIDGSLWIGDDDAFWSETREPDDAIYRIDPITFEVTIEIDFASEEGNTTQGRGYPNFNYSMTFTPDGKHLILGDIDANSFGSPNSLMVFSVVPEPMSLLLLGVGGCLLGARRRRQS